MKRRTFMNLGVAAAMIFSAACSWFPSPREPGYEFEAAWGARGSEHGEFREPIGIAIAGSEVFVSDAGNNRIQVFDLEGDFLRGFGHAGKGAGELGRPMLMDIGEGKLYVPEYLNDRLQIFSLAGKSLGVIGSSGSGPGRFDSPGGVAVDKKGLFYAADFFNHRVQVLGPDGAFIRQYGSTGKVGIGVGRFNYPTDVALLPDGGLVVADAYNDRIQIFAADGSFVRKWGGPFAMDIPGSFPGWFKVVTAVAVGPEGNIFAADFYNHRIQKFGKDGTFLTIIGKEGDGPGQLKFPTDMALDKDGNVYVVDFGNNRIQKFAPLRR